MAKTKMTKDIVPEDFTLTLAAVDAVPVLFFGFSMILGSILFKSNLFFLGACLSLVAGICKVLWKIIVVVKKKNIWGLFTPMRTFMPIGLVLMIAGVVINRSKVNLMNYLAIATALPAAIFFLLGFVGMGCMLCFGLFLDNSKIKNNWLEQITNGLAQISFFIGLLFIVKG